MATASRQLNYSGTFVYRNAAQTETSRIVHYVNQAGGEFEKMETLDGPAREVIRTNDQVICYLPETRTVLIEKRGKRRFPALVPEQLTGVADSYVISVTGMDRVAGHECRVILLVPKDKMRYGHRFCAEVGSGWPLRARTLNEKNEPLDRSPSPNSQSAAASTATGSGRATPQKARTGGWTTPRSRSPKLPPRPDGY